MASAKEPSQTKLTKSSEWLRRFDVRRFSELARMICDRIVFLNRAAGSLGSAMSSRHTDNLTDARRVNKRIVLGFFLLSLDLVAGMFVVSSIGQNGGEMCKSLQERCLELLQGGTLNLSDVLEWLMGNPVGLKLNKELATTLGAFFKHHVSLWQMYIGALTSFAEGYGYLICSAGYFGLSFQMALLVDIASLFTIHIQCFYIYMARLYNVQLRGLMSLARLFRGKKWNPLRQRVDHITRSVDQLFLGSMLLTILIFLLPTVVTFYLVFASLHFMVRGVQLPFILAGRSFGYFAKYYNGLPAVLEHHVKPAELQSDQQSGGVLDCVRKILLGEIV